MHRSTSSFASPSSTNMIGSEMERSVTVTLTREEQGMVNLTRRQGTSSQTVRRHNSNINRLITFLTEKVNNGSIQLSSIPNEIPGPIDLGTVLPPNSTVLPLQSIIKSIDLDTVTDKEAYATEKRKNGTMIYRTKDFIWNNFPQVAFELYIEQEHVKYHLIKDPVTNQLTRKLNPQGKPIVKTYDTKRKLYNAIEYGMKLCGTVPLGFAATKYAHTRSLKNSSAVAKKEGQCEERGADPIPWPLFCFMCECAVNKDDSFWWLFSLLQWNCMSRCQNIDNLKLSNLSLNGDAIVVQFDATKMDQGGEKTSPKHCYANPLNFKTCLVTAMACYFSALNNTFSSLNCTEHIFIKSGSGEGSAASNYTDRIKTWAEEFKDAILSHCRPNHVNTHGIRKGSSTHAASNTTCPPPLPSIFLRGEWSMGIVLDIYWRFAEAGDHYLGRLLAGLDSNSADFGILPPHFIVPISNVHVQQALQLLYGNIITSIQDENKSFLKGILLRLLASLVYHEGKLREIIATKSGHPFGNIRLLRDTALLAHLKPLVTIEPTQNILSVSTGLPPHTVCIKKLHDITTLIQADLTQRQRDREEDLAQWAIFKEDLQKGFVDAIEARAVENGQLTADGLNRILQRQEESLITRFNSTVRSELSQFLNINGVSVRPNQQQPELPRVQEDATTRYPYYLFRGKAFVVPETYDLPEGTLLKEAFCYWTKGTSFPVMTAQGLHDERIRPFALWTAKKTPPEIWKKFKTGWRKILTLMTLGLEGLMLEIENQASAFTDERISTLFDEGLRYVKSKIRYIINNDTSKWTVTTFSKKIQSSSINHHGTSEDKTELQSTTIKSHRMKRTFIHGSNRSIGIRKRMNANNDHQMFKIYMYIMHFFIQYFITCMKYNMYLLHIFILIKY